MILDEASRIFNRLTMGQYTKILLTDTQAKVQQANGQWMEAFYLSKGALDSTVCQDSFCLYFPISEEDENSSANR